VGARKLYGKEGVSCSDPVRMTDQKVAIVTGGSSGIGRRSNKPLVIVTFAQDKFDANGKLVDDNTKKFLRQLLENLANWTRKLSV
jgi:hypothetical protein